MPGDDSDPVTKGDFRHMEDRAEARTDRVVKSLREYTDKSLQLHAAQCGARDEYDIKQQVYQGKRPPITQQHPLLVFGGGGSVITLVVAILTNLAGLW